MIRGKSVFANFCREDAAQTLVEYALIAGILIVISILAWYYILSSSCSRVFYYLVHSLDNLF